MKKRPWVKIFRFRNYIFKFEWCPTNMKKALCWIFGHKFGFSHEIQNPTSWEPDLQEVYECVRCGEWE